MPSKLLDVEYVIEKLAKQLNKHKVGNTRKRVTDILHAKSPASFSLARWDSSVWKENKEFC